ncbi:aminotransferase class I/II-fold pyridoxal phosphate-dependent enzyme [Halioglobus maricola]|uniref:Aminotransferase class I/II-fold pyridoxal phosphate-dependent enzyme n=1 Tax=Halioglobus maricola TaxID=2601894 RepID=A0A5P9NGE2_9GAMM|nr:methionine aminotransferase [Halioglobus maricola]QFU74877.1 aminotransferase class I/II-fold pyridoxal phosphate-dependent enzyme [Halioglobus maricola]
MVTLQSKLPNVGTTIFTRMSAMAAECGAINLSQGFPDFEAPLGLREALARATMEGHNQYAPMAGLPALREQLAHQLQVTRGVRVNPDTEITVVPGATEGIYCAVMASVRSGDEVVVLDPCYDSYAPSIELAGGVAVHVPLSEDGFTPDWQRIRAAITSRTRMIMINTPHNPTGSTFTVQDMDELERLVEEHDLLVCSDEVYEHLVYDGKRHCSVLQWEGLRQRSFAHYSFGKTFSVTGWKTGYCVAPPALTAELRKVHQFVAFVAVTPVQQALADFLAAEPNYPQGLGAFYQAKRDLFIYALRDSRFAITPSSGTYFQLLDYSAITSTPDHQLCEQWTRELGVASIPISPFSQEPPERQVLRFCFAKSDEVLLQAAEILCKI